MKRIEAKGQEMRIYRARRKDTNEWVKGYYVKQAITNLAGECKSIHVIFMPNEELGLTEERIVHLETVAQSTGLKDKNGDEIFEGMTVIADGWWAGIVTWQEEGSVGWCVEPLEEYKHRGMYGLNSNYVFEIISEDKP